MSKATDEIINIMSLTEDEQQKYFENLPPDGTSTRLIEDLNQKPQSEARDAMIERARGFGYDDFRFTMMYPDCVCPKIKLADDAGKNGYMDIVRNVWEGKYD